MSPSEFADFQRKTVRNIVIMGISVEKLKQFFPYQFRYLKKVSAFSVELAAAAKVGK